MEALKGTLTQLQGIQQGVARSQLSSQEKTDLQQLEEGMRHLNDLKFQAQFGPSSEAAAVERESQATQARIDQICQDHHKRGSNLQIVTTPEGPIVDLGWQTAQVTPEMRDQGFIGVKYGVRSYTSRPEVEVSAAPIRADGKGDWHYIKYRVSMGDQDHWRGHEATVGTGKPSDTIVQNSVTPMGRGSENVSFGVNPGLDKLSDTQRVFLTQVLGDLGVGWLTPTVCQDCHPRH
jgi:hypothetical protein